MAQFLELDPAKQPSCKVELHVHLEGAIRVTTAWELAAQKGICLKAKTLDDLYDSLKIKCPSNLTNYLKPIYLVVPLIAGDVEAIERIAYEFCEDAAKQGVLYSELRYCPHLFSTTHGTCAKISRPVTPREVVMAVNRGLSRADTQLNLTVRSILSCFTPNPEWSDEILDLCIEFRQQGVVGIDVAGNESLGFGSPAIVNTFRRATSIGVHRTAHAGEAGPANNIYRAMVEMHCERIGHGYHVLEDEDVYAECLSKGIHFETCPYSSCLTGAVPISTPKHPIVRFVEDEANFSISRDDPMVSQKTLDDEYDFLRGFGLKDVHFARANFNAARSCFLPTEEKRQLLQKLVDIYGAHDTLHSHKIH